MNVVGTFFSPEEAREVSRLLDGARIPYELRRTTDEGGLERTELLVDDSHYEDACDVVESWQSAQAAASQRKLHQSIRCVKCGSSEWDRVEDESYTKAGLIAMRCRDCGCVFTRYGYGIAT